MPVRDTATTLKKTTTTTQRELSKSGSLSLLIDVQRTQLKKTDGPRKVPQQSDSLTGIMVNAMFNRRLHMNPK